MQRLALRCALALSLGFAAVGTLAAPSASAATGTITGLAGKCLDVAGASAVDGTAVQVYDCNGTAAQ
ncbi:chitinase, partial [Streptomyces pseudovenezuelae]